MSRSSNDLLHFNFWAPNTTSLDIVCHDTNTIFPLRRDQRGCYSADFAMPPHYMLRVDGEAHFPDPTAGFFPLGVHGPSANQISEHQWRDAGWRGLDKADLIIYELHVGTFSEQGTIKSLEQHLDYLESLGITCIELMPITQCPGGWNWGYDGVGLFAVNHNYGTPDDLKSLVDACHNRGIAIILDVVYNHIGPEGNYLGVFGPYFSSMMSTPWGDAFNYDGDRGEIARQFIVDNVLYWLQEFHLDGLRLDAIHYMHDGSDYSIQQEICDAVRQFESATQRKIHLIGETNVYDHHMINSDSGNSYSAIWADDLMHSVYSIASAGQQLTPREYRGAQDVDLALRYGYVYQGPKVERVSSAQRQHWHGSDPDCNREHLSSLIVALQTHDSAGNQPDGRRVHQLTSKPFQMAAAPLFMLSPGIPMIFMGEEFAAESPFLFFSDFQDPRLREAVDRGRKREFAGHLNDDFIRPSDARAFYHSKLQLPIDENPILDWYKRLIAIRKRWLSKGWIDSAHVVINSVVENNIFVLEFHTALQRCFVMVCLESPKKQSVDFSQAVIELDSNESDGNFSASTELVGNRAIVGYGKYYFIGE